MAVLTALRFGERSGALCVDQESWFLMNRKTFFSDLLFPLLTREQAAASGLEVLYGGVGHPPFHVEVVERARAALAELLAAGGPLPDAVSLGRLVRDAFVEALERRIDDRLRFLYGFTRQEYVRGWFERDGRRITIDQERIRDRVQAIIEQRENLGYGRLTVPNEACVAVLGPDRRYMAFALKSSDGVLSFQSCGFEALGVGRYNAAARIAKSLNRMTLDDRRRGMGPREGIFRLIAATLEAWDHFGQAGGNLRLVMLDGEAPPGAPSLRELAGGAARLAMEIVRAASAGLLPEATAIELVAAVALEQRPWPAVEEQLFRLVSDPRRLEKLLRGYKLAAEPLPPAPALELLFGAAPVSAAGKEARS
jgi:hypothetical protein